MLAFNRHSKIFYRPVEVALRWCLLMDYEAQILQSEWTDLAILRTTFPQWPCLHANTERVIDAVQHGELPYGCLGLTVSRGTPVDISQLTVRHTDLRMWMSQYYPEQKPPFLFDPKQNQLDSINVGTYLALQADREALKLQVNNISTAYQALTTELEAIGLEKENIRLMLNSNRKVSDRSETAYLHIIGAMLNLLLGHSPSGKPHSVFRSQSAIVDALIAYNKELSGVSKRTLDEKFAAAKRSLSKR